MSDMSSIQKVLKIQEGKSIIAMKYRIEFIECLCKNLIEAGMVCEFVGVRLICGNPSEAWKKKFSHVWIERLCFKDVKDDLKDYWFEYGKCSECISVKILRPRTYGCSFIIHVSDYDYYSELISSDENYLDEMSRHSLKLRKDFMKIIKDTITQHNDKNERKKKRRVNPKTETLGE